MSEETKVGFFDLFGWFTEIDGTSRRLQEARDTYQKVLELDSRHSMALGFLGLVHHLMGDIDKAIIKYHEVGRLLGEPSSFFCSPVCRH